MHEGPHAHPISIAQLVLPAGPDGFAGGPAEIHHPAQNGAVPLFDQAAVLAHGRIHVGGAAAWHDNHQILIAAQIHQIIVMFFDVVIDRAAVNDLHGRHAQNNIRGCGIHACPGQGLVAKGRMIVDREHPSLPLLHA